MHIVIIGSGMAGITLAEEIHKYQSEYRISVLSRETHGYYSRPMLSHGFSRDDVEDKIILKSIDQLQANGIGLRCGVDVTAINRAHHTVTACSTAGNETFNYDRLVLAPGSDALIPPPFRKAEGLYNVINSLDDLIALRCKRAEVIAYKGKVRWAVIGGGLIGCEVASDLAKAGDDVVLYHALPRLMERQLEEEDSASLLQVLQGMGINVKLDAAVAGFETIEGSLAVRLADDVAPGFDAILVACGFKPRIELAQMAGLDARRGIMVNEYLCTSDPEIFALGDAAECGDGRIYAYVMPIRQQALWLARYLTGLTDTPWVPPAFSPRAKVHGFTAAHPYLT